MGTASDANLPRTFDSEEGKRKSRKEWKEQIGLLMTSYGSSYEQALRSACFNATTNAVLQ